MKQIQVYPYTIPLTNNQMRSGVLLKVTDNRDKRGWGEVAPLPKWSQETLDDCLKELSQKKEQILSVEWSAQTCLDQITDLKLLPALSFGLESALLAILEPLPQHSVPTSALLMGSAKEILEQAKLRYKEGFSSAKLKVGNLTLEEAGKVIHQLRDKFHLRIDVNRAWSNSDSLHFFSKYPLGAFDYIEEPFENTQDLSLFPHPIAIDESFPHDLSLQQIEQLPNLRALIYKPTIQGGMANCIPLYRWASKRGISLVLSSSFESDLGLAHIASIAHRLSISTPIGIGTYQHLAKTICANPITILHSIAHIPALITPKTSWQNQCSPIQFVSCFSI